MKFYHLHCHTEYSLLDGLPKIDEFLDYALNLGFDGIAITDHGNIYGAVEFFKKAKERKIKPILGCEFYLAFEKYWQKRPKIDDKRYHLVLLVKNEKGYKNLVKLITKSHLEGFYYKPRIDEDLLFEHSEGLICLTACLQGKIPQLILANKIKEAESLVEKYLHYFGKENFYLEIQHHPNLKEQKKVNKALIEISKKLKVNLVATNDCHYLSPEDAKIQDILMLINTGADPSDPERLTMLADDFSMRSPEKMIEDFKNVPEAIENTQKIVESCNFDFEFNKIKFPYFPVPEGETPESYLRKLAKENLVKIYGENPKKEILERFEYELSTIEKLGFASYFLIVQDFVNFAKQNNIAVGPGRGSVGGSLIAYLLGITEIDPIKYNLLFERFLNPDRVSLPDIDVDFSDEKRERVIEYITQKYGKNRVAQIITFGRMNARAVVRDVGRVLGLSYSFCDKIAKMIPPNFNLKDCLEKIPEFKKIFEEDERVKNLISICLRLEGVARHISRHACGLVISKEPLDEICPLQYPTQDDRTIVTQFEMHSLEDIGLTKFDVLGLKNLTLIEETLDLIEKTKGKKIDLKKIPFDDKKTFSLLQRGETVGIFQLESAGMQRCLRELKPTEFEHIVAVLALYRPGPLQFMKEYIDAKNGRKRVEYLHPKLKPILESTYGICLYQEQIMKIAQELAGFSLAEADILRKAIGKKEKQLLFQQKSKFIEGCIKNGISEEIAQKIWNWIEPFGSYSFNRSHSVAYAHIAYQTAYLKAHYPLEFMTSLLNSETGDVERIGFLIEEAKRMGIKVLPPDINESYEKFTLEEKRKIIRFGLLSIKNVGWNTVERIIRERERGGKFKSFEDFLSRIEPQFLNKKFLESLIKVGVFDQMEERKVLLDNIERILEFNKRVFSEGNRKQRDLFGGKVTKNSLYLERKSHASKREKLLWEKELLGLFITSHPLEDFKSFFEKAGAIKVSDVPFLAPFSQKIKVGGFLSSIKKVLTKNGKIMFFAVLEDLRDKIELIAFPELVEKKPEVFQENKIVLASGKVDTASGNLKIICEDIEEIVES